MTTLKTIMSMKKKDFFFLLLIAMQLSCKAPVPAQQQTSDSDPAPATTISGGIAKDYPNDAGIEKDPNVLYVEKFDDGLANITGRYTNVYNAEGMSLDTDVPAGSAGSTSLKMTNIGGQNTGGHLYRNFPAGFGDVVYIRYYVKYPSVSKGFIHHEGIWFGGYNPSTNYPNPQAGDCGLGDRRISIAYEPVNGKMGSYLYWGEMESSPNGKCWGNDMVNGSPASQNIPWDQWMCVEIMIKLNNPVSENNGELRIWHNGTEVGHWGPGFPNGSMLYGKFSVSESGQPFKGFRWRTDANLKINYVWIEYYDDTSPANVSHYIKYDNLVIAKKYIGPIKN